MHSLAALCVRRPVFATMLIVSLTVVGIYSFFGLGVEFFPNVDFPTVAVTVTNPGASAEQIENEITKKIEGAVNTINGIDQLQSTSVEGQSTVVIQFLLEKSSDVAAQEVRDRVNLVIGDLPETALAPIILKFDPSAQPIMRLAIAAPRPLRDVTRIADLQIKQRLESIDGVGQVSLVGGADREIQVRLDPDRMRSFGVSVTDVSNALRQQNVTLPGGRVDQGARELTLRTMGKITDPRQFEAVAIANRGDYVVRLADIADVVDGQAELRSASYLNGKPAVTLVITKQSGANAVTVARAVKTRLEQLKAELPADLRLDIVEDTSLFTEASIAALQEHLILGSLLASAVIFFFLANIRTTLIAAIAIPTSIVSTFGLMRVMDYSLNQITMLALTLMVGVVIDDAIIVLENIYRFIEEKGMRPFEAAIEGTKEIGLAVMATTLSLLAVFVPVGFMGGIVGRVLSSFGLTAAFAVGVSLLVSFTLTPMLTSRFVKVKHPGEPDEHGSKDSRLFRPIERTYMGMLRWSMAHRGLVVLASVVVIASIVPLFIVIGKDFAPEEDRGAYQVSVRAAEGTGIAAMTSILERIAADLRTVPEVQDTLVSVGGGAGVAAPGGELGTAAANAGSIFVKMVPLETRTKTQAQMLVETREILKRYPPDLRTAVQNADGPGGGAGMMFALRGPDLEKLGGYAEDLLTRVKASPIAVDADTSLVYGKPELRVDIDRQKAADLGVRVQDVAQALRILVGGDNVSTFDVGDKQYNVRLRAKEQFRTTVEGLERMTVPSSKRGVVGLGEVVTIAPATGPSAIGRMNRERQVMLTANVAPGYSQQELLAATQQMVSEMDLPAGYTAAPAGFSQELANTAVAFVVAISLSFIFMYIVLAAQFESFLHPITILLSLPLAIPFGILSLLIAGQTINIFSGLGLLLLFGIVKKNAILQIDHTNGLRERGLPRLEAILQANKERLRPILMTTIALVAGMLPMLVASGAGSASNRSIGVLVAGGQTLCLLLTLLAVPVFYSLFDDLQQMRIWSRIRGRKAVAAPSTAMLLVLALAAPLATPLVRPAGAQTAGPPEVPARVGITGTRPLSLQEAVAEALANNPDIAVAKTGVEVATLGIAGARGAFDPQLSVQTSLLRAVQPVSSIIGGAESGRLTNTDLFVGPRVQGLSPVYGTSYQFALSAHRQTTDNTFTTLNPTFPSALSASVTQPLFRGRLFDDARRRVEVAKKNEDLSDEQFRQRVMDVTLHTEQAYADLAFATENLQVQMQGLDLAREQVASNRRLVDQGVGAPIDVVEAETQVAATLQGIATAQAQVTRAENALKALMAGDRSSPIWSTALEPTTPIAGGGPDPTVEDAVRRALAQRPELAQQTVSAQTNEINTRFFREQTKPQIDLVGSYTSNGLAGAVLPTGPNPFTSGFAPLFERINTLSALQGLQPIGGIDFGGGGESGVPPLLTGGVGQSLTNLLRQDFPTFEVGVRISLPLRDHAAQANLAASMVEGRRLRLQRQQMEAAIEADVRNALQTVASARATAAAATQMRELAEQQYASEQRRFEAGTSTVFFVVQRQSALIASRSQQARAHAELEKSLAALRRVTGQTLDRHSITLHGK